MALLRWYGSPGCFDSGLQLICIVGSGVSHLPLDNSQVKSSHLYLYSAFNNTDCVKALNSIKLEDRVSVMYNNKIKHSIFS